MKTRRTSLTTVVLSLVGGVLGGLLLAAPPAFAQSAVSSFTPTVSGTVGSRTTSTATTTTAPPPENINCTGQLKLTTTAVTDPSLPPGVVVSIDARGLSCTGQTTGAKYVNSGQANLTRRLVANDVIKTTFALYKNVTGGYLNARTGLLTLNLSYNTTTGALTAASGSVGSF